ncbi:glycosyltransferase family 4 protein [Exiguobacterium antarcticum]|uniref:Glycosyltransferase family 4 protein n=1 Tax=Exiguobacterium antarcticum TaxID=132920 RepID=A0ABT6R5Q9_9BACL|nr:glycosyltransferase family 4 protein [Exiguobacterium antarcticum]MDI3236267.1 glycosyltransferase family 4 protein [Exiguobacterium antarcticum]
MKIIIMCDNNLGTVGGEQESSKIILGNLKEKFQMYLIQPGPSIMMDKVEEFNIVKETRMKHLVKKPLEFLKYILKVRKIIKNVSPEIIHTQAQVSFFVISLLKKLNLIDKRIKIIHTERGLYLKYNLFFKNLFKIMFKNLDLLVTTTEFNMAYWRRFTGDKLGYEIIENTAGPLFENYEQQLENNKNNEKIVLGFAGRYCEWKNWPLAIEIINVLRTKTNKKLEIIMAVGCLDDKSYKDTLIMFDKVRKIPNVKFDGKININLEEMNKLFYNINTFVLTSNRNTESFGRTLVEAMSRKNIVLTTDSGGSVEVVENPENVATNAQEFADKILYYFEEKNVFDSELNQNLEIVKRKYSLKNNIDKHESLYKHI